MYIGASTIVCLIFIVTIYHKSLGASHLIPGGGGVDPRVLVFFQLGVEYFFFAESGVLWCYHGRFKRGWGDENVQSQIQNCMV